MSFQVRIVEMRQPDAVRIGGPIKLVQKEWVCGPFGSRDAAEEFMVAAIPCLCNCCGMTIEPAGRELDLSPQKRTELEESFRKYLVTDQCGPPKPLHKPAPDCCGRHPKPAPERDQVAAVVEGLSQSTHHQPSPSRVQERTVEQVLDGVRAQLSSQNDRLLKRLESTLRATLADCAQKYPKKTWGPAKTDPF